MNKYFMGFYKMYITVYSNGNDSLYTKAKLSN